MHLKENHDKDLNRFLSVCIHTHTLTSDQVWIPVNEVNISSIKAQRGIQNPSVVQKTAEICSILCSVLQQPFQMVV